jgi:hypothetical protein
MFGRPAEIRTDGYAPTLDEAKAEFETAWHRWLAWAKLSGVARTTIRHTRRVTRRAIGRAY